MATKLSLWKRYPIIPSIFFILFGWSVLYLTTTFKGDTAAASARVQTYIGKDWRLAIGAGKLHFVVAHDSISLSLDDPQLTKDLNLQHQHYHASAIEVIILPKPHKSVWVRYKNQLYYTQY